MKSNGCRSVAVWLFCCACAVFLMGLIGATTRLTESGLSIVRWQPLMGALPPLSPAAWHQEFNLYQQTPQYQKMNRGMSLDEFKGIYFWEWVHRLWGRLIGLFYLLPLLWFWRKGIVPRGAWPGLLGILGLGFLQGAMGWYMVKSGLIDRPLVSHYRLAAHLLFAFALYVLLLWQALCFWHVPVKYFPQRSRLKFFLLIVSILAVTTIIWGAFVAGLRAGLFYNNFPRMGESWIPIETAQYSPSWKAFFEEPATVQFTHRWLAVMTFFSVIGLSVWGWYTKGADVVRRRFVFLALAICLQVTLGLATLLNHVALPLAVAHQGGAFVLLTTLVLLTYEIYGRSHSNLEIT